MPALGKLSSVVVVGESTLDQVCEVSIYMPLLLTAAADDGNGRDQGKDGPYHYSPVACRQS